jgi:poly(3-hydroxybutyrate) depolymerase
MSWCTFAAAACRHVSDLSFQVGVADNLLLRDPARGDWPVPILIHYPIGATDQRPVVIWNHGGAPSAGGKSRSEEWGRALAAAGYIVIHPSRVPVDDVTPFQAQCDAESLAEEPQKQGKPLLGPLAGSKPTSRRGNVTGSSIGWRKTRS